MATKAPKLTTSRRIYLAAFPLSRITHVRRLP